MTRRQKYRDVARFLRDEGWSVVRQRGSHEIWTSSDGGQMLVVAQHSGEVSAGVVRQIRSVFPNAPQSWK